MFIKIVALFAATLVLSALGLALVVLGTHGSQVLAAIGVIFLLPSVLLSRLGVPISLPFMQEMSVGTVVFFVLVQTGYYLALLQLGILIRKTILRQKPDVSK